MNLSKESIRLLKLVNEHETVDWESACEAISGSKHSAYAAEYMEQLAKADLISTKSEMMPEGYKRVLIRITPDGQAELENYMKETREKWITRFLSISAIVLSAISIIWQITSSAKPE
ncbi:MAG: hypothetical protein NC489_39135 [Ruminococcus flavefaciens]|nr:hypothetical protein [Ruminococcus flavefaciens]